MSAINRGHFSWVCNSDLNTQNVPLHYAEAHSSASACDRHRQIISLSGYSSAEHDTFDDYNANSYFFLFFMLYYFIIYHCLTFFISFIIICSCGGTSLFSSRHYNCQKDIKAVACRASVESAVAHYEKYCNCT